MGVVQSGLSKHSRSPVGQHLTACPHPALPAQASLLSLFLATYSSGSTITSGIINIFTAEYKAGGPPDKSSYRAGTISY